jgi:hypothetical protein
MSLSIDLTETRARVIGGSVDPARPAENGADATGDDWVDVTCGACGTEQHASGRSLGYLCQACGSDWRVLRCPGCHKPSVVLDGTQLCPRCGHDYPAAAVAVSANHRPSWLTDPDPLNIWLEGVMYLGGHAELDRPVHAAGLLLDRKGIHLRSTHSPLTIRWESVHSLEIERRVLTVATAGGAARFEIDGVHPDELHARLARVLRGLRPADLPATPIGLEHREHDANWLQTPAPVPAPPRVFTPPSFTPPPAPIAPVAPAPVASAPVAPPVAAPAPLAPIALEPSQNDAPLEVLVVDALWKLVRLREAGLLDDSEVQMLRTRLLAKIPGLGASSTPHDAISRGESAGPLLHV